MLERVAVRHLFGGGIFLLCIRRSGSVVMLVVPLEMTKILSFGRMFGWMERLSVIDLIDCLSCPC